MVVVETLDGKNTAADNKVDIKKRTDFGDNTVIGLGRLITEDKVVSGGSNGVDTRITNTASMIKRFDFEAGVIAGV